MKMRLIALAGALLFLLFSSGALAAPVTENLHSTGFDASGNALAGGGTDASWTVQCPTYYGNSNWYAAVVIAPGDAGWFSGYAANTASSTPPFSGSSWVSTTANSSVQGYAMTYQMTFSLAAFSLSTVTISGNWVVADGGSLYINGNLLGSMSSAWGSRTAFTLTNTSFLNQGLNTVTLAVTQSDNAYDAANFQGAVTGVLLPEPSAVLLLATLPVALLIRRRSGVIA